MDEAKLKEQYLQERYAHEKAQFGAAQNAAPPAPPVDNGPSVAESALQGFGQGGTLGYLTTPQAATDYAVQKVQQWTGGEPAQDYSKIKEGWDKRNQNLQEANPIAFGTGNVAGSIATLPLAEGALAKAGLGAVAPGASALQKYARAAGAGATYGAVANTEGEGFDPYQRLKNAGLGVVMGAAGEGLAQGAGTLAGGAEKTSQRAVIKQAGANAGQVKKLIQKDQIPMIGEFMSQEGLLNPGKSVDDVVAHTGKIIKDDGPKIGQLYRDAQDAANTVSMGQANRISGPELADEIVAKVMKDAKNHPDRNLVKRTIDEAVGPLRDMGDNANIADLHMYRRGLDENINWGQKAIEKDAVQRAYLDARNAVNDSVQNSIDALDQSLGSNKLGELQTLNKRFSTASTINTMATQGQGRNMAKALMGQGIIGGAGGVGAGYLTYEKTHDPLKAVGVGLGTAVGIGAARKFGAPIGYYGGKAVAAGANAVSQQGVPMAVGLTSPWMNVKRKGEK